MTLKELLDLRGKAIHDARAILDTAETEKRDMTEEEQTQYNKHMDDQLRYKEQIDRETQLRDAERQIAEETAQKLEERGELSPAGEQSSAEKRAEAKIKEFRAYLSGRLIPEQAKELRSYQADSDVYGGYIVLPQEMSSELIADLDNETFVRKLARTFQLKNAASLGVASKDSRLSNFTWGTEIQTITENTGMTFGKRELKPSPATTLVKVSRKLLTIGMIPADQLVREELAYIRGINEEEGYLTGNGDKQPLGVFTASNDGISTGRDISTDNTTTAVTFDGLKNAKYALKSGYRKNAQWIYHRDAVKMLSKLKDGEGKYQWEESTKIGEPDRLLGFPVNESEYAPNTFSTGLYVGILGDFYHYWIVDALDMGIIRLNELFALNSLVGFISAFEVDGMPMNENAFARVKLA